MLILYETEDGKSRIQLRAEENTVWLTQLEIAELFNATKQNISLHLKNIFKDGELAPWSVGAASVVKESLTVQSLRNRGPVSLPSHQGKWHFPTTLTKPAQKSPFSLHILRMCKDFEVFLVTSQSAS